MERPFSFGFVPVARAGYEYFEKDEAGGSRGLGEVKRHE